MNCKEPLNIELLSPARNLECGLAAIRHGADAVYIGGPGFGARKNAGNTLVDIKVLVDYAHLFHARIYVTLNTLLFDHELKSANQLIHDLYNIGVDAVIIQDMGILETKLPPIPIHASTQTDNRSIEKVKFLEKVGFDQVVLARELSLPQIKAIRSETQVPLEYFIHGALCVCYSGRCYMSESINKRSANRGECAQPCRLKYNLKDNNNEVINKDKHLLSLKDLNLSEHLEDLIDAGISSFKIEGRLKDVDYVANITAHYRIMLDAIIERRPDLKRASSGQSKASFEAQATKSFNRGFTSYFVNDRQKGIWSVDSPKALGEEIGYIKSIGKNYFTLNTEVKLNNGDGLCFFTKYKELSGLKVNKTEGNKVYPNQMGAIRIGAILYRNFDKVFTQETNNNTSSRKINTDICFNETNGNFELSITDEDSIKTIITANHLNPLPANNPERAFKQIKTQISKLGNTTFAPVNVHINLKGNWFFQAKELNALRRDLVEKHERNRLKYYPAKKLQFIPNNTPFPNKELNFTANIVNTKAHQFYERHGVKKADWGFEKYPQLNDAELMRTKHCLLYMNNQCLKKYPEAGKLLPLTLYNKRDSYLLEFDCKNCEMIVKRSASNKKIQ